MHTPMPTPTPVVSLAPLGPNDPRPAGVKDDARFCVVHFVDGTTSLVDITDPFFHVSRSGVTLPRFGGGASFTSFHLWANPPDVPGMPAGVAGGSLGGLPPEMFPLLVEGGRAIGKLLFNRDRNRPRFARLEITRLAMDAARIELLVATQPARYTESGALIYDVIFSAPVVLPPSKHSYSYHFLLGSPIPGLDPTDGDDGEEDELDPDPVSKDESESESENTTTPEPPPPEPPDRYAPPRGPNVAEKN